jgi:hypothetical protein
MISVGRKMGTTEKDAKTTAVYFEEEITETNTRTPRNSWVRLPVKTVSVARKLNRIEERSQDQSCFGEEITGKKTRHRKLSWVRVLTRMVFVARKLITIEERRQGKICSFRRGDYRN